MTVPREKFYNGKFVLQFQEEVNAFGPDLKTTINFGTNTNTVIVNPRTDSPLFAILILSQDKKSQDVQFITRKYYDDNQRPEPLRAFLSGARSAICGYANETGGISTLDWLQQGAKEGRWSIEQEIDSDLYAIYSCIAPPFAEQLSSRELEENLANLQKSGLLTNNPEIDSQIIGTIREAVVNSTSYAQISSLDQNLARYAQLYPNRGQTGQSKAI